MIVDEEFRKKAIEIANEQIRELRKRHPRRGLKDARTGAAKCAPVKIEAVPVPAVSASAAGKK